MMPRQHPLVPHLLAELRKARAAQLVTLESAVGGALLHGVRGSDEAALARRTRSGANRAVVGATSGDALRGDRGPRGYSWDNHGADQGHSAEGSQAAEDRAPRGAVSRRWGVRRPLEQMGPTQTAESEPDGCFIDRRTQRL